MPRDLLPIPFQTGQQDKEDIRWLMSGGQTSVINGRQLKRGSFEKRRGYTALSKNGISTPTGWPSTLSTLWKLFEYDNQLCAHDGHFLWTYSANAGAWQIQDHASDCVAIRKSVAQSTQVMSDPQVAEGNGYRVFVWNDGPTTGTLVAQGDLWYSVLDVSTGSYIAASQLVPTGTTCAKAKIIVQGTTCILAYFDVNATRMVFQSLSLTTPGSGWSARVVLSAGSSPGTILSTWDICPITGGGSNFVYCFQEPAPNTPVIQLNLYTTALAYGGAFNAITLAAAPTTLAVRADSGSGIVWLTYSFSPAANSFQLGMATFATSNLNAILAATNLILFLAAEDQILSLGIEQYSSTRCVIVGLMVGDAGPDYLSFMGTFNSSGSGPGPVYVRHASIMTRPFMANGRCYAVFSAFKSATINAVQQVYQTTHYLCDLPVDRLIAGGYSTSVTVRPVCATSPRFAFTQVPPRSIDNLAKVTQEGNPTTLSVVAPLSVAQSAAVSGRAGVTQTQYNFQHPGLAVTEELGETVYISGGIPSSFDGAIVSEIGFLQYTSGPTIGVVTAAGGSLANQKYSWQFVWEWTDLSGNRYQSSPSEVVQATPPASGNATFTIQTQALTTKQDVESGAELSLGLVIYRTSWNGSVMSTVLYRATPDAIPIGQLNPGNANIGTITLVDDGTGSQSDSAIAMNSVLYTSGGVLPHVNPECFVDMCVHRNRLVGIAADQRTVYMSNAYVEGGPIDFTDAVTFTIDESQGGLLACFRMDSELYFATEEDIWYFTGDGPLETGQQSQLDGPFHFQTGIGVTDPRSVVEVPTGTMFLSLRGIVLLTRSRTIEYIGAPVEATLAQFPVVTSAVHVASQNEVRFTCANAGLTSSIILVYNYLFDVWSEWQVYDGSGGGYGLNPYIVTACEVGGIYYWGTDRGSIYQETNGVGANAFTDAGQYVNLSVSSAWVALDQVEGYMRLHVAQVVADALDEHSMTVSIDYNRVVGSPQSATFANLAGGGAQYVLEQHASNLHSRCESVRVTATESQPAAFTTGQGPRLGAFALEYRKRPGRYRQVGAAMKG
jgi:hypothetical protein